MWWYDLEKVKIEMKPGWKKEVTNTSFLENIFPVLPLRSVSPPGEQIQPGAHNEQGKWTEISEIMNWHK